MVLLAGGAMTIVREAINPSAFNSQLALPYELRIADSKLRCRTSTTSSTT
jgi:hypothetical protein